VLGETSANRLALLRLLPALNSTVILMFAFDEYLFLSRWMKPTYRAQANALLAPWFAHWLSPALYVIVGTFCFSFAISLANIFTSREALQLTGAEKWYWYGFAFQVAHFLYAPPIMKLLKAISEDQPKGDVTSSMKKWLRIHLARSLTTDLPAWVFFIVAEVSSEPQ
jgi:hypothetical protein